MRWWDDLEFARKKILYNHPILKSISSSHPIERSVYLVDKIGWDGWDPWF